MSLRLCQAAAASRSASTAPHRRSPQHHHHLYNTVARRTAVRHMGGGGHHAEEPATIDPKWFEGLEEGVPVEHPLKMGLLFPPKFTGANAPTAEEYQSGKVKVPIVVESLEWTLTSPPPLHQFDEPPIIVEFPETEGGH